MQKLIFHSLLFLIPVCSASLVNKQFNDFDYVIQTLLTENKFLKSRLDTLQDRVLALEENCGKSVKSVGDERNSGLTHENYDEVVTSDREQAIPPVNDTEEYSSLGMEMVPKMLPKRRTGASDVASLAGNLPKRATEGGVAFHAYVSSDQCYSSHQIINFDVKVVDVGGGYNTNDGIYNAPATGLYVFSWTIAAAQGTWFMAELMINGAVKGIIRTEHEAGGPDDGVHMATGVVLAYVNAGDHVFIRFFKGANCTLRSNQYVRTTFTGWLLL